MKTNVLVFPCGSEIGLEIHRSLRFSTHYNLIGASSVNDHGMFVYKNYIGDMPQVDDKNFVAKVNELTRKYEIDYIFPAHDSVVVKLAEAQDAGILKAKVVTSPATTCRLARSKKQTYQLLKDYIPVPLLYEASSIPDEAFPVFLKPDVGQGSKGTHLAKDRGDVEYFTSRDPSLLAMEYLPGREYTIDCFTDRHGNLLVSEGRERTRISNGISVSSTAVRDNRFSQLAEVINQQVRFRGMWFFQVKERRDGELVLMEVSPRIAGTMGLIRCKGVNLALLALFDAEEKDVKVFSGDYAMTIDRALYNSFKHDISYSHVYLDFDDSVVLDGKVNPLVIAFVFQCINKNIPVTLITKHTHDLHESLKGIRMENLFDRVIWIKPHEEKFPYIQEKDAIFIDDSYAERKKVSEQCGIPAFDTHMLESLMEYY